MKAGRYEHEYSSPLGYPYRVLFDKWKLFSASIWKKERNLIYFLFSFILHIGPDLSPIYLASGLDPDPNCLSKHFYGC